jgi:hypothetical protein
MGSAALDQFSLHLIEIFLRMNFNSRFRHIKS